MLDIKLLRNNFEEVEKALSTRNEEFDLSLFKDLDEKRRNHFLEKIDTHTLSLLQQGDEKAFDTIFWKYNPRVFHFIHSLLYDKILAEDLTQNVFLKIWERHQDIKPEEGFEAYLFTIARNMVYKETEKRLLSERFLDSIKLIPTSTLK